MKNIQNDLKAIVKALGAITKKMENIAKLVSSHPPVKAAKKTIAKKAAIKKVAAKRTVAKKGTVKRTIAKKAPAKKAAANKTVAEKAAAQGGVIDAVSKAIKSSKKGVTVAQIRTETGLSSKQISNVCYKLTKKGTIVAKSRGLYVAK